MGNTIPFAGTDEIASRYAPVDLAILNLGCARIDALGDLKVLLSADEASRYAQALGARRVLPIHLEGWAHLTEGRNPAASAFATSEIASRTLCLRSRQTAVID